MKLGVIVVDIQGDFTTLKKGSLQVRGTGRAFVKKVEEATRFFKSQGIPIYATQDWHPSNHISFYTSHKDKKPFDVIEIGGKTQILWPPHCIKGTENARILIDNNLFRAVIKKGQNPNFDSYSGFEDEGGERTELDEILKIEKIEGIIVYGIAFDYCVKATALDGIKYGYKVFVIEDLCKGVGKDTSLSAKEEMVKKGVKFFFFDRKLLRMIE